MIVATIKDQLGNQMFAYASIKALAADRGVDFGYVIQRTGDYYNSTDKKYGHHIDTVFNLPEEDVVFSIEPTELEICNEMYSKEK